MNRREFLKTTAVGLAAGTQGACATLPAPRHDTYSPERLRELLVRFDAGLAAIDGGGFGGLRPAPSAPGARGAAMVKRAFRSLYTVGALSELELEDQAHPAVQERMARMLPEMAESLRESAALLESATPADAARVRQGLKGAPALPIQLAEAVDGEGAEAGVSPRTRRKFRAIATQVGTRLRHHDPAVLAQEYVAKVRKIEAWSADGARVERQLVARIGRESFLDREQRFSAAQRRWAEVLGAQDGAGGGDAVAAPWRASLRGAAWCFGLGAIATGLAFASENPFVVTAAAVLLVTAVLFLLLAGLQALVAAGRRDAPEELEAGDDWTAAPRVGGRPER